MTVKYSQFIFENWQTDTIYVRNCNPNSVFRSRNSFISDHYWRCKVTNLIFVLNARAGSDSRSKRGGGGSGGTKGWKEGAGSKQYPYFLGIRSNNKRHPKSVSFLDLCVLEFGKNTYRMQKVISIDGGRQHPE